MSQAAKRYAIRVNKAASIATMFGVCMILAALLIGCASSGQPTKSLDQWEAEHRRIQSGP
jgi:hypothetical protein